MAILIVVGVIAWALMGPAEDLVRTIKGEPPVEHRKGFRGYLDNRWEALADKHQRGVAERAALRDSGLLTKQDLKAAKRDNDIRKALKKAGYKTEEDIARAAVRHQQRVAKIQSGIDPDTDQPLRFEEKAPRNLGALVKGLGERIKTARAEETVTSREPLLGVEPAETIPTPPPSSDGPGPVVDSLDDIYDSAPKDGQEAAPTPPSSPAPAVPFTPFADARVPAPTAPAAPAPAPAPAGPGPVAASANGGSRPAAEPTEAERLERLKEARARVHDFQSGSMTRLDRKPNSEDAAVLLTHGLTDADKQLADWALQPHPELDEQWRQAKQDRHDAQMRRLDEKIRQAEAAEANRTQTAANAASGTTDQDGNGAVPADREQRDVHNHAHAGSVVGIQARDIDDATVVMGATGVAVQTPNRSDAVDADDSPTDLSPDVTNRIADVQAMFAQAPVQFNQEGITSMIAEIRNREDAKAFAASVAESIKGTVRFREYLESAAVTAGNAASGNTINAQLCENAASTAESAGMGSGVVGPIRAMSALYSNLAAAATGLEQDLKTETGKLTDFVSSLNAELAKVNEAIVAQDTVADVRDGVGREKLAADKYSDV